MLFFVHLILMGRSQFLMDMIDTSKDMGRGMLSIYKRFSHIQITGYLQPQFQMAESEGAGSFNGGDFSPYSNNRFMLRRGRILFGYVHYDKLERPTVQFVFQFDGTERGVFIRDLWGRIYENRFQRFAFVAGMFARPFGYEINLASADREAPERGRMSQTLMKTERDLGVMISFEAREKSANLKYLHIDLGVFNGQGLSGPTDYDSYKDLIGQVLLKPYPIGKQALLSGGISYYNGGLRQNSRYSYQMGELNGTKTFVVDSSIAHIGRKSPRIYYGINAQLKLLHKWGATEIRGEYWQGTQAATEFLSETAGSIPMLNNNFAPYYTRKFNGAFFYFLQNIINNKHQLVIKYDWYDPNTRVKNGEIGKAGSNTNIADIRFNTLGFGYIFYILPNAKMMVWYDLVKNEITQVPGFSSIARNNIFTLRFQFRF